VVSGTGVPSSTTSSSVAIGPGEVEAAASAVKAKSAGMENFMVSVSVLIRSKAKSEKLSLTCKARVVTGAGFYRALPDTRPMLPPKSQSLPLACRKRLET